MVVHIYLANHVPTATPPPLEGEKPTSYVPVKTQLGPSPGVKNPSTKRCAMDDEFGLYARRLTVPSAVALTVRSPKSGETLVVSMNPSAVSGPVKVSGPGSAPPNTPPPRSSVSVPVWFGTSIADKRYQQGLTTMAALTMSSYGCYVEWHEAEHPITPPLSPSV